MRLKILCNQEHKIAITQFYTIFTISGNKHNKDKNKNLIQGSNKCGHADTLCDVRRLSFIEVKIKPFMKKNLTLV